MLDKRRAGLWVKIVAIVVAGAFIATLIPAALDYVRGSRGQGAQGQDTDVDRRYAPVVQQLQTQLRSNPTSTALLVQLGNAYLDWGIAQQQEQAGQGQSDLAQQQAVQAKAQANLALAAEHYGRALKADPKNGDVRTDRAISLFYLGKSDEAIREVQRVLRENPDHENALFNAGIFYAEARNVTKAREVWQRYLKLVPTGQQAEFVRQRLSQLK